MTNNNHPDEILRGTGMSNRVSVEEVEQAATECESLLELTRELRVGREAARMAVDRLGMREELEGGVGPTGQPSHDLLEQINERLEGGGLDA
jgi:hypothetical protein